VSKFSVVGVNRPSAAEASPTSSQLPADDEANDANDGDESKPMVV